MLPTLNKDIDISIVSRLDDKTLFNFSLANKYMYNLCKDNNLWRYKFMKRYNVKVLKDEDYLYKNYNWQKLYRKIKYDHISVMQKSFEYKRTKLVIVIFDNYEIGDEEIIEMLMEALLFSHMDFVYHFFDCKRIKSLNLTELFRVSCDSRAQVEKEIHVELFTLLQIAGLSLEAYDLIFAIRARNIDIVKSILSKKELKDDMIKIIQEIYKEAVEIYNDDPEEEIHILKTLCESYLSPPLYVQELLNEI